MGVKFKYDKTALENIKKFFDAKPEIQIGILSDEYAIHPKEWKNGKWVPWSRKIGAARLAAVHEFGADIQLKGGGSIHIPQRSFFRRTMRTRRGDFTTHVESNKMAILMAIAKGQYRKVLGRFGSQWKSYILETFASQGPGWKPLSDVTLGMRRKVLSRKEKKENPNAVARPSEKILWVTGAMARSITWMLKGDRKPSLFLPAGKE